MNPIPQDALLVVILDLQTGDGALVLLQRGDHRLRRLANVPHAHHAIAAARQQARAVVRAHERRHTLRVRVVDRKEQRARLRAESADAAVRPARDDGLAVGGEARAQALEVRHLDAQQLVARPRVPHANVVLRARGKQLRVAARKDDVVDRPVVARRAQLVLERGDRDQVDVRLLRADEKVIAGRVQRERRDAARDLDRAQRLPRVLLHDRDRAVAGGHDHVAALEQQHALHAEAERLLLRARVAEQLVLHGHFENVAALRAQVGKLVVRVDQYAAHEPLHRAELNFGRADFAIRQVKVPDANVAIAARDDFHIVLAEKTDALRGLVGRLRAAHGVAGLEVPHDDFVVVRAAERGQVLFVGRECDRLDLALVQYEPLHDRHGLEVPHEHRRLRWVLSVA